MVNRHLIAARIIGQERRQLIRHAEDALFLQFQNRRRSELFGNRSNAEFRLRGDWNGRLHRSLAKAILVEDVAMPRDKHGGAGRIRIDRLAEKRLHELFLRGHSNMLIRSPFEKEFDGISPPAHPSAVKPGCAGGVGGIDIHTMRHQKGQRLQLPLSRCLCEHAGQQVPPKRSASKSPSIRAVLHFEQNLIHPLSQRDGNDVLVLGHRTKNPVFVDQLTVQPNFRGVIATDAE